MSKLAFSTATSNLSVAILNNDQITEDELIDQRNHAVNLLPMIEEVIKKSNTTKEEISEVLITDGPGSYTGVRIGVTTAKMLAKILQIPVVGVSTLKLLAYNNQNKDALVVSLLDARNDNFFAGIYEWKENDYVNIFNDQHINFDDLLNKIVELNSTVKNRQVIFIGASLVDQVERLNVRINSFEILTGDQELTHAGKLFEAGINEKRQNADEILPSYLRVTEAEKNWQDKNPDNGKDKTNYVEEV